MNYQNKYLKYKNKYLELKNNIQKGGECDPLPDNMEDEEIITLETFNSRTPNDRITIENRCYFVRELYHQIITLNHNVPHTNEVISDIDKQRLIDAYDILISSKKYEDIKNIEKNLSDDTYTKIMNEQKIPGIITHINNNIQYKTPSEKN